LDVLIVEIKIHKDEIAKMVALYLAYKGIQMPREMTVHSVIDSTSYSLEGFTVTLKDKWIHS
jgi:hypothetical protein